MVRRVFNYLVIGYLIFVATAVLWMLIAPGFTSAFLLALAGMPWGGFFTMVFDKKLDLLFDSHPHRAAAITITVCIANGLINAAIISGIARLFRKSNVR